MRHLHDSDNAELAAVIESLLSDDVTITVREVARRHPRLRNASAFTRNVARMALIEQAQRRQNDARSVVAAPLVERAASMSEMLAAKSARVDELRSDIAALVASHAACIKVVLNHGGMAGLERFWKDYKCVGEVVHRLSAVPPSAQVVPLTGAVKR